MATKDVAATLLLAVLCGFSSPSSSVAEPVPEALYQAMRGGATYSYLFDWRPPLLGGALGSCHGLEIPFVFGAMRAGVLRASLIADRGAGKLSDAMQRNNDVLPVPDSPKMPVTPCIGTSMSTSAKATVSS